MVITKLFPRLGWIKAIGGIVKVHNIPLLGGALVGSTIAALQITGTIKVNMDWAANQSFLDWICSLSMVCLSSSQGPVAVSSLLSGAFSALLFERFYRAEVPSHPGLGAADAKLGSVISLADSVGDLESESSFPGDGKKEKPSGQSNSNINKG